MVQATNAGATATPEGRSEPAEKAHAGAPGAPVDVTVGTEGPDTLQGGDGNDAIDARGGDDRAAGGGGRDFVLGGGGDDFLAGDGGAAQAPFGPAPPVDDDFLADGDGDDTVFGDSSVATGFGDSSNVVLGGAGNDALNGGFGRDTVLGGAGDDLVRGYGALALDGRTTALLRDFLDPGDLLLGGAGSDTLGGGGADTIFGEAGDDVVIGGAGVDALSGGPGADRFVFSYVGFPGIDPGTGAGEGNRDVVADFRPGEDVLDLSAYRTPFRDPSLTWDFDDAAGGTVVRLFNSVGPPELAAFEIGLAGVRDLAAADIVFWRGPGGVRAGAPWRGRGPGRIFRGPPPRPSARSFVRLSHLQPARPALDPAKFRDPRLTAKGEKRAAVALSGLRTLWINTGTLCNITCRNCYIESSPRNDALAYIAAAEVASFLDEIARDRLPVEEIGFTGGEPFLNRELPLMLRDAMCRGHRALVLTNAMRPMRNHAAALSALRAEFGGLLTVRVSLDHHDADQHDLERQEGSFAAALDGLEWLAREGFRVHVAGRLAFGREGEAAMRAGFGRLFAERGIPIDATDPVALMLFPEMDAGRDVPEITESCWGILNRSPDSVMCASTRMVVKRKGAERPAVLACTLLPYDPRFELGSTLAEASRPVPLNHPHCASFCVLGGAACSR